jgi:hypothetical protein
MTPSIGEYEQRDTKPYFAMYQPRFIDLPSFPGPPHTLTEITLLRTTEVFLF